MIVRWGKRKDMAGYYHATGVSIQDVRQEEYYHRRYGVLVENMISGFQLNLYIWFWRVSFFFI